MNNYNNSHLSHTGGAKALYTKTEISEISKEVIPETWVPVIGKNLNTETIAKIQKGKPGYDKSDSNYKNTKTAWFLFGNNGEPTQALLNKYSLTDILITYILADTIIQLLFN